MSSGLPEFREGSATDHDWHIPPAVLLDRAPSTWLLIKESGGIFQASPTLRLQFGYELEDLTGKTLETLLSQGTGAALEAGASTPAAQEAAGSHLPGRDAQLVARRKDGSEFPADVLISPVETSAGSFLLAVIRDVSQRLEVQEERVILKAELDRQEERERIGMDLHDGVMQEVYAVGLTLELALVELDENTDAARRRLERAIEHLHDVIRDIRSYIFDLRPREFTGDLASALSDLAREFQQNSRIPTSSRIEGTLPDLAMEQSLALYHIAHEALSNVQKHAQATEACVVARGIHGRLELEVKDNGAGFDTSAGRPEQHRGLRNMRARARAVGAQLEVGSRPGGGTSIQVKLNVPVDLSRARKAQRRAS